MTCPRGSDLIAAFTQGSTWNTSEVVGAGDGLALLSEGIAGGRASLPRDDLVSNWGDKHDQGAEGHEGPMTGNLYAGANCGKLFAFVMGQSGAPTPGGGSDQSHTVELVDALDKYFTLVLRKRGASGEPWDYSSAMVESFRIGGSGNERVTWEAGLVVAALDRAGTTNDQAAIGAATIPIRRAAYRVPKADFRINAAGGAALTDSDRVKLAGFTVEVIRPLSRDWLAAAADGDALAIPCEDGPSAVTLGFDLRVYDTETWIDSWEQGTEWKWDLRIPSGYTPAGGAELEWFLECPRAALSEQPQAPVGGPGRIPHAIAMKCLIADTAPAGMTGLTQPLRATIVDEDANAYIT